VPEAVAGHSQGEIAAAVVAGVLSLEDGAKVAAVRSQALAALGPARVAGCAAEGVAAAKDAAQIRDQILAGLAGIRPSQARVPLVSTVTGQLIDGDQMDAGYWYRNLREDVRFQQAVTELAGLGVTAFVEISSHPVLVAEIKQTLADLASAGEAVVTGTLRRGEGGLRRFALSLAELYVRGVAVDWTRWFAGSGAQRVELPTYAFQHQRYWPQRRSAVAASREVEDLGLAEAGGHPLLGVVMELADGQGAVLTGRLSVHEQPWLADYVVLDKPLLPGTAFLDLAVRAGDTVGCPVVEELTMQAPLVLPAGGTVQVQVVASGPDETGRRAVRVYARPAGQEWTCHATGVLAPAQEQTGEAFDFTVWPPRDAAPVPAKAVYEDLAVAGYEYGSAFQGLAGIWRRGQEVFVEARLSGQAEAAAGSFGLHPALLDAVLHALSPSRLIDADRLGLPFSWTGVTLHAVGAAVLRARLVAVGPAGEGVSMQAADETGGLVISAQRLMLRPLPSGGLTDVNASAANAGAELFTEQWIPVRTRAGAGAIPRAEAWAVIGDQNGELAEVLGAARYPGLAKVAAGTVAPAVVVVRVAAPPGIPAEDAMGAATEQVRELVRQWLAEERLTQTRLVLLTCGAVVAADGDRITDLPAAAARGLARSAQPGTRRRLLLVDIDGSGMAGVAAAVRAALACGEPELAVRRGLVLARRLVPVTSITWPQPESRPAGGGGTMLVTGGTEVLGALVARHLAARSQAERLVLASRSGPAAPGAARLVARLAGLGMGVLVAACDAADRGALVGLVTRLTREPMPLTGVIHAAGEAAAAWYLHELTQGTDLAQFILISSAADMPGRPGHGNYAAGKAFLDALAQFRRNRGLSAISLAWGFRAQTGMTMGPDLINQGRAALGELSSREARALLDATWDQDQPVMLAARFDIAMLRAAAAAGQLPALLRSLVPGPARQTAWYQRVRLREGWRYRENDEQRLRCDADWIH
jgi:malonyl CoA-acyl carrier protein transacylase